MASEIQVTIVSGPADTDQVIDDSGARVFVDESVSGLLDDKLLDASVVEDQVHFVLASQGMPDGFGPSRDGASGDL